MALKTLLVLIFSNLIWSAHPLMGKLVLADFSPAEGAWLRYMTAFLGFLAIRAGLPKLRTEPLFFARTKRDWVILIAMGAMTFCFSPLLQMTGLNASQATDNALIIAIEPMITVLLAWVFLREKVTFSYALTFAAALLGFVLLTGVSIQGLGLSSAFFWGDVVMLISLLGEGFFSVGGRLLMGRHSPVSIFGLSNLVGVIFLTIGVGILGQESPWALALAVAHKLSWKSALAVFWMGPVGTTATYLSWMYILREATVGSMVLTLFVQPVFGSVLGLFFLREHLSPIQGLGGIIILFAVFAQTLSSMRRRPAALG